mgnify:CR=1 FL=1
MEEKGKKALIVVDVQNDFMPGGALGIQGSDKIIPVINSLLPKFSLVIFTKDWHPENHKSFASQHNNRSDFDIIDLNGFYQVLWPDHCIKNTPGADIHKDIHLGRIYGDFYIFKKGTDPEVDSYSAFYDINRKNSTGLKEFLKKRGVIENYICGLTLDYSVSSTAIDSVKEGFKTCVIEDATCSFDLNINNILKKFKENKVNFIESWELDAYNLV